MTSAEFDMSVNSLLLKIHVITGWAIPSNEIMLLFIDQFKKKAIESYPLVNTDEVEFAFRKFGIGVKDWGKSMNLSLIDEVMQPYLEMRFEISKFEESKKIPELPAIMEVSYDEKIKECDEWEQKKDIKLSLIPLYLYDYFVLIGRIQLSVEEKKVIYNKAAEYRLSQLQNETELDRSNRHEFIAFNDLLIQGIQNIKGIEQERLRNLAKKIAVFEYLKLKQNIFYKL